MRSVVPHKKFRRKSASHVLIPDRVDFIRSLSLLMFLVKLAV